jgi:hypothetical protein
VPPPHAVQLGPQLALVLPADTVEQSLPEKQALAQVHIVPEHVPWLEQPLRQQLG